MPQWYAAARLPRAAPGPSWCLVIDRAPSAPSKKGKTNPFPWAKIQVGPSHLQGSHGVNKVCLGAPDAREQSDLTRTPVAVMEARLVEHPW